MRRRSLAYAALLLSFIGTACADNKPTVPLVEPSAYAPLAHFALGDYIQETIYLILPNGFENTVDARWATVKKKKAAGDLVGAAAQLATLVDWMDKKTSEVIPPPGSGETKEQAVGRLVLNMMEWLYGSETAPPHDPITQDVVVQVIPAGQSATVVVPSDHAGFDMGPQPQTEIVVISQESEELYPGQCNGPLVTPRCQVPLFYKYDIQPNTGFVHNSARFAVCMIGGSSDERRPLDYAADELTYSNPEDRPVHHRMKLAHEKPVDPNDEIHGGGYVEGNIEFLPQVPPEDQKGFVQCDEHSHLGMGAAERALHSVMHFVERVVSPKDAYAYDSGPEHLADAASHFNGVDPQSGPDLSVASFTATPTERFAGEDVAVTYSVENRSRRNGGHSTAKSQLTSASVSIYSDAALTTLVAGPFATETIDAMVPDASAKSFTPTITLPSTLAPGTYWIAVKVVPNSGDPNFGGITEVDAPGYANNTSSAAVHINTVTGNGVFVFGDIPDYRDDAAAVLRGLGYNVTTGLTLATDLNPYSVIWHVGAFTPLTSAEITRLAAFLARGGGLHLTGERPCCDEMNNSLTTLVNTVVVGGGVTVGNQGDINGSSDGFVYPFNGSAFGGVTTSPNSLTNWTPYSPGGMLGVSGEHVFATGSSCYPVVEGCGTVIGAVWGESHLLGGKGRLTLLMDIDWFMNTDAITPIVQNIQYYLNHGVLGTPILASISSSVGATPGKSRRFIPGATSRSLSPRAPKALRFQGAPRR
jgi:hypothetical protein